jgi:hypothetical protein
MGFSLPPALERGSATTARSVPASPAAELMLSYLSPLTRGRVLPPHHPSRAVTDGHCFPYPRWSAGAEAVPATASSTVVEIRGDRLSARIDVGRGGRIVDLSTADGAGVSPPVRTVVDWCDARGAGLRGGIEVNTSRMDRSPWALEPVSAALGLPSRVGGERLRWWQLERASGYLAQVDLHLPSDAPILLLVVRQTRFTDPDAQEPTQVEILVDDAIGADVLASGEVRTRLDGCTLHVRGDDGLRHRMNGAGLGLTCADDAASDANVTWIAFSLEGPIGEVPVGLLQAALAGLDDPMEVGGRMVSEGPGWAGLELDRLQAERSPLPPTRKATPVPAVQDHNDVSHRRRIAPEAQWLHLFRDEGLGTVDRVHPKDVGQPAGRHWASHLASSQRREALGDWRVHLRAGELAFLDGDLDRAESSWLWSYALRPTAWSDRNLALVHAYQDRPDLAAVRYLRAHRVHPEEIELAVEGVGALIAAERADDASHILNRMMSLGQAVTARHWLLEAEASLASGRGKDAGHALAMADSCIDSDVNRAWATALASTIER